MASLQMTIEKAVSSMQPSPEELTEFVSAAAKDLGFARSGVTGIETPARYPRYRDWLERGDHGSMGYMDDDFHKRARADMRELLPDARNAIVVALSYEKQASSKERLSQPTGRVAQYALGDDYHHVMRGMLGTLAEALSAKAGTTFSSRICIDSAPLLERELAERAGLGFVAKNTMLISPGIGSYTLLGVLLTSAEMLTTKAPSARDCGGCTACLEACPTQAFRAPYSLDAKRCISYLTIESQGAMPEELRQLVGDRIFGCDVCQDVCPYNAVAPDRAVTVPELRPRDEERARPPLTMLAGLGSNQRKRYVGGTALRRNRREQLLRNVAVVLGNIAPEDPVLETLAADRSPLVQEHAKWAIAQKPPTS
ncbi:MAG: tRNA epoxyqueuosine(34) reductase QueG [Myxococcales bacterium]|nr:tRNA epoxyqueuosine(34) reductase QueG [Myxococcales bacterium]